MKHSVNLKSDMFSSIKVGGKRGEVEKELVEHNLLLLVLLLLLNPTNLLSTSWSLSGKVKIDKS